MRLLTSLLRVASLGVLLGAASAAFGQLQVFGTYQGKRLPVINYDYKYMVVQSDTGPEGAADLNDIEVHPTKKFADGFVKISDVHAELNLLQHGSAAERADPSSTRAKYSATITADRGFSNCFGLLTFVNQGSVGTRLIPIGRLGSGSSKTIKVEMTNDLNSFGSLHILTGGVEIRTNEHPDAYDLVQYYADLVKNVKGVSAVELLSLEERYDHVLSLDAHRLATIRKRGAKKVLLVIDLDSMTKLSDAEICGADDWAGYITWISKDQLVYIAPVHDAGYKQNLFLMEVATGKTRKLMEYVSAIIESLPDHPEILEIQTTNQLFQKFNALTGATFDSEDPDAGWYYFDFQGKPRVSYSIERGRKFYKFRPTPTSRWQDLDDLVKQPGLKFNGDAEGALDRVAEILKVGRDGDTIYISTRLASDTYQLAAFSMSQGVITKTIGKHPKFDLTTADGGWTQLLFAKRSPRLLGMVYQAQKPRVNWMETHGAAAQKSIDAQFPDHVNIPLDWSEDLGTFIYYSFSDRDPGTYYYFQTKTGTLMPLMQLNERLKGRPLSECKPIEFTARDGTVIPGYVTFPAEPDGKLPPLIVRIHGGPMARDSWGFDATNQFFATRGYAVLQVNYRGSSGYGAAFQNAGLRKRFDTNVIDDIADGVRDLIAKHQVDPNRIAVMGASFGGWATYICLAKYPDLFRTGVVISGVTSWKKAQSDDAGFLGAEYGYRFWKAVLQQQDYDVNAKYLDPLLRVSEIKQPLFIVHGEQDNVVHPTEARLMLDALKKQGNIVEAKSFSHASHTYWPFPDRVESLNEAAAFLERSLPAAPETSSAK